MLIQEDYFKNIFNTVREAILILDENMRVLSANRSFFTIFKVDAANTIGSLLYDLGNGQWNIPYLRVLLEDVLPKNDSVDDYEIEHKFESIGHKIMLLNACKIREKKNDLPMILLAIEDISERRKIENGLEKTRQELETTKIAEDEAGEFAECIINTVREPLLSLDQDLKVVTVNRSFCEFFKVKPEDTVGQLIYDLGNKQWDIPELRDLLETILPQKTTLDNYEVEHDFTTIGRRIMLLNARQIQRGLGKERIILLAIEDITERKRLEDLLTESEERYRRIFETASDGIVLIEKREGHIIHANPAAEKMLGYSEEEYVGKKLQDIGVSVDMSDFPEIMKSLNKSGILNYDDVLVKTRSGQDIYADIYMVDRAKLAQCNIRDVSERRQKEKHLQRLNRTLLARSKSSKAMMSAGDETWYLNEVCRIIVEDCGHALVWIGFAEQDEGRTVRPVAHYGFEEGYLDSINITWSDMERGSGPVGTSIRTGKPVFRNVGIDPAFASWREEAVKRGYSAVLGVPLLADGKAFGSLNIYSRQEDPFSNDEVQLLTDMAADLAYGIAAIRLRIAQMGTELSLRESEARLRTLVQTIPDLVWLKDANGTYLFCNPMFERFFGAKEADIIGKTDYDFINGELADLFRDHDRKAMAAGKPSSQEDWITFADDGRRALMDTIKTPMYAAGGSLVGVLGIARDITERKLAEEALATSEEQFRKLYQEFHGLLDAVPDNLMLLDKDLKVLWANRVAAESIGGTPEAFAGQHCHSLWYERTTPCDPCPVLKSFSTGRPLSETVTRPDGRIFDIRTVPLRDEGGSIARVIEVVREVTEHSRLEAQYLQAQKMESIGTLAGGVAHDFNNILSAIIGYGHVTLMKMANDDPLRSNIEHILEAADRAARLTKELLLFSRKHVSERKPVDVNEVVSMVKKFLRMVIGEDIECKTMLQAPSLPVNADSHQLEQVLMNLATNARDAMPRGGAFTVKTEQIDLTEDFISAHGYGKSGPYAMITISDTGIGMDEATRKRIFEPFYTTKEVGKGTGLGLAVVYGIIKQHDGFINVYSEPGKGTTFRIYLPIIGALVTEETKAQHREAPARGTETVLVAEDDENLRKLSRTVLAEFGYTVIEAVDGEEAVKKFMENKDTIQLLLFDLIMPKMNGKEASDEIRKIKPDMKVLFASGYDPDLLQQKALLEDGVHLVYKPISPMDLLRKVRSVLDGIK